MGDIMGNLKKLFMRIFEPQKYWIKEISQAAKECKQARERYYFAKKYHRKRSHLRLEYELAERKFNKIYQKYYKVIWDKEV